MLRMWLSNRKKGKKWKNMQATSSSIFSSFYSRFHFRNAIFPIFTISVSAETLSLFCFSIPPTSSSWSYWINPSLNCTNTTRRKPRGMMVRGWNIKNSLCGRCTLHGTNTEMQFYVRKHEAFVISLSLQHEREKARTKWSCAWGMQTLAPQLTKRPPKSVYGDAEWGNQFD